MIRTVCWIVAALFLSIGCKNTDGTGRNNGNGNGGTGASGKFAASSLYTLTDNDVSRDVALANWDSDAADIADLFFVNLNELSKFYRRTTNSDGEYVLNSPEELANTASPCRRALAADVDGDGKTDLILGCTNGTTSKLFKNRSTGTALAFDEPVSLDAASVMTANSDNCSVSNVVDLAVIDTDGNGVPNYLVIVNESPNASCIYSMTSVTGGLTTLTLKRNFNSLVGTSTTRIALCDLNNDGILDLVFGTLTGATPVLSSSATYDSTSFTKLDPVSTSATGQVLAIGCHDRNGDGFPELLLGLSAVGSRFYKSNGNASSLSFDTSEEYSELFAPSKKVNDLVIRDLNNDGAADVYLATDGLDELWLYNSTTKEYEDKSSNITNNSSLDTRAVKVLDIDTNGTPDLILATSRQNEILLNAKE